MSGFRFRMVGALLTTLNPMSALAQDQNAAGQYILKLPEYGKGVLRRAP